MAHRLSACMIVKDESGFIEDCLRSLEDAVDEIVVVDTGSTDGTQDLVRSFKKAKLVEVAWEDDFAKARNISLDHATGDWILIVDADERLHPDDVKRLRKLIRNATAEAYFLDVVNFPDRPDETLISRRIGLFRRRPDIRFENRIHEQVDPSVARAKLRVEFSHVRLLHHGYDPEVRKNKRKSERNRRIIERALQDAPDNPFMNFNLAQEYFVLGEFEQALTYYRKALEPFEGNMAKRFALPPYVSIAVFRMVAALASMGSYPEAFESLHRYQLIFPDYTELRFMEARLHSQLGDYERALGMYHQCIAFGDSPALYYNRHPGVGSYRAWYEVARIYELIGQPQHAFEALNESLKLKRDYGTSILALARLALEYDAPEEVYRYLKRVAQIEGVLRDGSLAEAFINARAFETALAILDDTKALRLSPEEEAGVARRCGMIMTALSRWEQADEAFAKSHPRGLVPVDAVLAKLFAGDIAAVDAWLTEGRVDAPLYGTRALADLASLCREPGAWTSLVSQREIEFVWEIIPRIIFYGQPDLLEKTIVLLENYGVASAEISLRLGKILWSLRFKELATEELIKAAQAGRFDKESLEILAGVSRERGLIEDEVAFLKEAHSLTDGDPTIAARLARALGDLGRAPEALEILGQAREKHPYAAILESVQEQIRKGAAKSAAG